MQQSFFTTPVYTNEGFRSLANSQLITKADLGNLAIERSSYNKWYCVREILYEQYLWDMRCWHKPKYQYSKAEVKEHIVKWIRDHEAGNWTSNCGHCLFCIRKLLATKAASLDEVAEYCLRNNFIKYSDQIGVWDKDPLDDTLEIKQTGDCLRKL